MKLGFSPAFRLEYIWPMIPEQRITTVIIFWSFKFIFEGSTKAPRKKGFDYRAAWAFSNSHRQSWAEVGRQLLQQYWLGSANKILSKNPNVPMPDLGMCTSLQTFWPFLMRDGFAPAAEGVSAAWSMVAQKGCLCTSLQACGFCGMPVYHDVSY